MGNAKKQMGFSKKETEKNNEQQNGKKGPSGFHFSDKYPRGEGETRIYNLIVLDESGSMSSIGKQALNGANETIRTIREAQQENPDDHQMISFVTFDSGSSRPDVRTIIDTEKIENVKDLTPNQYQPSGCTPLYDAMGLSINAMRRLVKEGDHVLVTVITDGYENSSIIYDGQMVKNLVDELSGQGWVFTYIGANQNSEETASCLGIHSTMDFKATIEGSVIMFDKMRSSNREYYKKVRRHKATGEEIDYADDFFSERDVMNRVTPSHITELQPGQIFVFGSNESGRHIGGAAKYAKEHFGAVEGQKAGLQGQCYAIPTMNLSLNQIRRYVEEFIMFADAHPDLTFFVTRIGCGIAGFKDEEIAPFFAQAYSLPNVYLPMEFWKLLTYRY